MARHRKDSKYTWWVYTQQAADVNAVAQPSALIWHGHDDVAFHYRMRRRPEQQCSYAEWSSRAPYVTAAPARWPHGVFTGDSLMPTSSRQQCAYCGLLPEGLTAPPRASHLC